MRQEGLQLHAYILQGPDCYRPMAFLYSIDEFQEHRASASVSG